MTIAALYSDTLLNLLFGSGYDATAFPNLATFTVGLSSTAPTSSGGSITEPSGGSYARVGVTNNGTNWTAASADVKATGATVTFPVPTASWGNVSYWFIIDSASVFVCSGTITGAPVPIGVSTTGPSFAAGALTITLS